MFWARNLFVFLLVVCSMVVVSGPVSSAQVYDYESISYLNLVGHNDPAASWAFSRVDSVRRAGCYSGRFELRPGDQWPGDNGDADKERSELSEDSFLLPENTTMFYGFSVLIPASQVNDCVGPVDCKEWRNFMQWHSWPVDGTDWRHPIMTLSMDAGKLSFILAKPNGIKWYTKIATFSFMPDTWIDFVVEFRWSKQMTGGLVRIWRDGVLLVNRPADLVGYPDQDSSGIFWKHGIYRRSVLDTDVVYWDELRRGVSFVEVAPGDKPCRVGQNAFLPATYHVLTSH